MACGLYAPCSLGFSSSSLESGGRTAAALGLAFFREAGLEGATAPTSFRGFLVGGLGVFFSSSSSLLELSESELLPPAPSERPAWQADRAALTVALDLGVATVFFVSPRH